MKRSIAIALVVATVSLLGFSAVFAAIQPAAIEYYVPDKSSDEVVVSVTDTNGNKHQFDSMAYTHAELAQKVAARLGAPYEVVNSMLRRVDPPSVWGNVFDYAKWVVGVIVALIIVLSNAFIVRQKTAVIIERLGKYNRTAQAGFRLRRAVQSHAREEASEGRGWERLFPNALCRSFSLHDQGEQARAHRDVRRRSGQVGRNRTEADGGAVGGCEGEVSEGRAAISGPFLIFVC